MKNLTLKKLESLKPCEDGLVWFKNQKEKDVHKICIALLEDGHASWANWLLARLLNKKNKIRWAIYAAESVIDIFEKKCPDDKRPREAILAAKKVLKSPTKENKKAAYTAYAAAAAYADATAAYADATAYADTAAAYAAAYAAAAAYADATAYADTAAAYAAAAYIYARKQLQIKLVKYAHGLLSKQGGRP